VEVEEGGGSEGEREWKSEWCHSHYSLSVDCVLDAVDSFVVTTVCKGKSTR
jgi:hypothetical protein